MNLGSPLLSLDFAATILTVCYLGHLTFGALISSVLTHQAGSESGESRQVVIVRRTKNNTAHRVTSFKTNVNNALFTDWANSESRALWGSRALWRRAVGSFTAEKRCLAAQRVARR